MKVYLQYPWKFPDSPYYKYLIQKPPRGIEFLNIEKQKGAIINKRFFWASNFLKRNIRRIVNFFKLPIPNAHLTKFKGNYDLIHCAHCLSRNLNKPWVADIERAFSVSISELGKKRSLERVRKILLRRNCKKILPWSKATEKELLRFFPEIKNKTEVVYPAVPERIFSKKKKEQINLIFSGRYFFKKGGLHALEAMDILTKKYPKVYGIFNSEIPKEILKKYSGNKKIRFYGLISQEKLFSLYKESDISIYPGYSDSFGFAYLESMSFGVPIITLEGFARKETVPKNCGFIIASPKSLNFFKQNEELAKEIAEVASKIIENKKLLEKMSKNCLKIIKEGKFSIGYRNKKLERIYKEALK